MTGMTPMRPEAVAVIVGVVVWPVLTVVLVGGYFALRGALRWLMDFVIPDYDKPDS